MSCKAKKKQHAHMYSKYFLLGRLYLGSSTWNNHTKPISSISEKGWLSFPSWTYELTVLESLASFISHFLPLSCSLSLVSCCFHFPGARCTFVDALVGFIVSALQVIHKIRSVVHLCRITSSRQFVTEHTRNVLRVFHELKILPYKWFLSWSSHGHLQ